MAFKVGPRLAAGAAVAPVLYGIVMAAYLFSCLTVLDPELGDALYWPAAVSKLATVVAIPVTLFRVAGLVENQPQRSKLWWQLGAGWSALGIAAVAVVASFGEQIALATAKPTVSRIWPGTDMAAERGLVIAANPAYTFGRMMITELMAMVVIAWLAALCVRMAQRIDARLIWTMPVVVFGTITLYATVAPWAWIPDYDFFIGDSILGGLWYELAFFMGPTDAVSVIALSVGASTLAIAGWNLERRGRADTSAESRDLIRSV